MAAPRPSPEWERINAYAARFEPEVRDAILKAFTRLRDLTTERALVAALEAGDVERAVSLLFDGGKLESAYAPFRERVRSVLQSSGTYATGSVPRLKLMGAPRDTPHIQVRFDVLHPAVIQSVQSFDTDLMTTIARSAREGARATIHASIEAGYGPRKTARELRQVVGLGPRQSQAVVNFRRYLETGDPTALDRDLRDHRFDRAIRRAWDRGESLTADQVDRYTRAYERRYRAWQAENTARTTTIGAYKEGERLAWEQASAEGVVRRDEITKTWLTASDDRVRDTHAAMNGVSVPFDQPWVLPDGRMQMVPGEGEFSCRCVAVHTTRRRQAA